MEHRFVSPGDDFVLAIAMCKQRLIKVEAEDLMREIMSEAKCPEAGTYAKPELPLDLAKYVRHEAWLPQVRADKGKALGKYFGIETV